MILIRTKAKSFNRDIQTSFTNESVNKPWECKSVKDAKRNLILLLMRYTALLNVHMRNMENAVLAF